MTQSPHQIGHGFARAILPDQLHVTLLFGRPTTGTARELVTILEGESFDAPRLSLFDASAVEAIETESFEILTAHMHHRRADLSRVIVKQAIVTPSGMPGAIVSGYRAVFDFAHPVAFFTDRAAALDFLGCASAAAEIAEIAAGAHNPLVHRLRQMLLASVQMSLVDATRRLVVSERTLQRQLQLAGTSFSAEVLAARVAIGKRLLAETDLKLDAIAAAAGCSSAQSFATMFRRVLGESPSEFRARMRPASR